MITTFYAERAYPTRSSVLAAVAVQLARWRYRTLCIDWNLSAPGVTSHFSSLLVRPPGRGTFDVVHDVGDTATLDRYVVSVPTPGGGGYLDLLPSHNRSTADDAPRVDWVGLHREFRLGEYLESCAEWWRAEYDAVLIDAPTGTGPAAGICVAHLPDALVLLIRPEELATTAALLDRAERARDRLPYDRSRLLVVPSVLAGPTNSDSWLDRFDAQLGVVFDNWVARDVPLDRLVRALTFNGPAPAELDAAVRLLAALLAREFRGTELLSSEGSVEQYIDSAAAGPADTRVVSNRAAYIRTMAAQALEDVLVRILSREEWTSIERSVLAMSAALDVGDIDAVGEAAADVAMMDVRSAPRSPDESAVPAALRRVLERVIRTLRP